ncbi:metallophosphoesterase [Sphingobacterium rhinopitheci]|uniref:metallophosphoesterase n=1 Tax=Sphingobacterium rhinopitheci TaxID=2781960 RepID=UPI001F524E1E|nr:metallophosphoesterase [Sphingobacterium rhinopitheci]MCI0921260.1 metallophosphoesterase [Sphingobacterium rhinopitheci]
MKHLFYLLFCFLFWEANAQSIAKRIILIGDAGEINTKQSSVIHKAAELIIKDSTLMFFLGDNIYPSGMGLEGIEKEKGINSLNAQFEPFRKENVPVYFLAGNHDWNVSRPGGLAKLIAQGDYLKSQNDQYLKLIPSAGQPGPVSIPVNDALVIIAYDSEYWLYPYHSSDIDLQNQRTLFVAQLKQLFENNKDKTVLVLSHHPMITYGEHSLAFDWRQHIFPLRKLNSKLYIPLPVVGSLYPLARSTFYSSAEDYPSKKYQELVHDISEARGNQPNVIYAAGHDHGLQFISKDDLVQIVSGSGSKTSFIVNNKNLKFKYQKQGFCVFDYLDNGNILLAYYTFDGLNTVKAYETLIEKK